MLPDITRRRLRGSRGKYKRYTDKDGFCQCPFCLQQFRLLAKAETCILSMHALHSNKKELTALFLKHLKELLGAVAVSIWSVQNGSAQPLRTLDWPEDLIPSSASPITFRNPHYSVLTTPLPYSGFGPSAIVASALTTESKMYTKQCLLDSLAKHAAIAFDHMDTDSYYMKRTASLELLREIARQFATNVHLNDLFTSIYTAVSKVIIADVFFVALYDENVREIEIAYVFEAGQQLAPLRFPLNDGPTSQVIKSNAPLKIALDSSLVTGALRFGNPEKRTQSLMFAPVTLHDNVLGALSVQSYSPNSYTEDDLLLLSAIANQAAIAIHNAQLYEHVLKLANTDSLTGLMNKRAFTEALSSRIAKATAEESKLSLIMIDSDSLKIINDTYGHCAGDDHLRNVADVLRTCVRAEDLVCRYGGDEFMLLLADTDITAAIVVAERIVERVRLSVQMVADVPVHVTISAGVAEFPSHAIDSQALIRAADNDLRAAKQAGKNRVSTTG